MNVKHFSPEKDSRRGLRSAIIFAWIPHRVSKPKQVIMHKVQGKAFGDHGNQTRTVARVEGKVKGYRWAWREMIVRLRTPKGTVYYDLEHWETLKAVEE